jgi:hypothetical protein
MPRPQSSASRAANLFAESKVVDDEGKPVEELLYGIKRSNGGFVGLSLNANTGVPSAIQWYDADLDLRARTELMNRFGVEGELIEDNRVMSMFDWQPVADQFFAIGALGIAGHLDHFREGFYITQLQAPGNDNATPMARMVSDLHGLRHYAFPNHEFISVDGDIVFFLEMNIYPSLWYYDTRNDLLGHLEGFPGSNERIEYPRLGRIDVMYEQVARTKAPVGIYSDAGFLYAVLREPSGGGVTTWKVVKLEPDFASGALNYEKEDVVLLPTQRAARHLYILPSEATWLVLELGPMPPGSMKHHLLAAVTLPHSWISKPQTSPLREQKGRASAPLCLPASR